MYVFESEIIEFNILKSIFGKNKKFELIFRASRDGRSAQAFHLECDGKSRTLSLFQISNGDIIGAYTEAVWDSLGRYKSDKNAFIFYYDKERNKTSISKVIKPDYAIYGVSSYGPTFGDRHDLYSTDLTNLQYNLGSSFSRIELKNSGSGYNLNYYQINFIIKEFEVFQVE